MSQGDIHLFILVLFILLCKYEIDSKILIKPIIQADIVF
jgi:hypothetical protein